MTTRTYFNRGDHVTSTAYPGIAMWFLNYGSFDCPAAAVGEFCECEPEIDYDTAIVQMVGDDRKIRVDADTLSPLSEGDFCGGCGQTGCGHGR